MRALALLPILLLASCPPPGGDLGVAPFPDCRAMRDHLANMARREVADPWLHVLFPEGHSPSSDPWGRGRWRLPPTDGPTAFQRVATDGATLVTLAGHAVVLVDVTDPTLPEQLATVPLDGRPRGLLFRGTTVWVLSDLGSDRPAPRAESDTSAWRTDGTTLVTAIDVSNPEAPRLLRELYLTGRVRGSRRDGGLLTLAHSEHVRFSVPGDDERAARIRVDGAEPTAWLPQRLDHLRNTDGSWSLQETPLCECTDVWSSRHEAGPVLTAVSVLDLDDPLAAPTGSALVGRADAVTLGRGTLAVAWEAWEGGPWQPPSPDTVVVSALDLSPEGRAVASYTGSAPGALPPRATLRDTDRLVVLALNSEAGSELRALARASAGLVEANAPTPLPAFTEEVRYLGTSALVEPLIPGEPYALVDLDDPARPVVRQRFALPGTVERVRAEAGGRAHAVVSSEGTRSFVRLDPVATPPERYTTLGTQSTGLPIETGRMGALHYVTGASEDAASELELLGDDLDGNATVGFPEGWSEATPDICARPRGALTIGDSLWFVANTGTVAVSTERPDIITAAVRFEGTDPCADRFDDTF